MNKQLALTLDFGTQSVRASLVDDKGNIVAICKKSYDPIYISTQKGFAEQDADFYWDLALVALKELCKENKDLLPHIVGATITTFRDTAVLLDDHNKPIRKVILWLDQRMAKGKERLPLLHWTIFKIIGMKPTIVFNRSRTIAHWIKENEPSTWMKINKYVNISTYLTYKLTGNLVDSSASMVGHYPINYKTKTWYPEKHLKARIFGIPSRMLCDLKQPGEVLGLISNEVCKETGLPEGIKVFATGSDKACETIGLGALNNDVAAISYGTACTVEVSNQKYHEPETFLPAYAAAVPGWYNMDVQIYRGYWMLTWFTQQFSRELTDEAKAQKKAVEDILNSGLENVPPGSDGLVLQPYWGPGLSRPLAKGGIVGFSDVHTREHLYRAIIEGIAYGLKEGLQSIEKHQHHKVSSIMISGGGSKGDIICQITSDIFGLPVSRVQTFETTTLGAATSIFLASGRFHSVEEAMKNMSRVTKTFSPNEVAHQQYEYLYNHVYLKLYPQLKNVYKDLNHFSKRY